VQFNFVDDDDEELLDLETERPIEDVQVDGLNLAFEDEIPEAKTLADPEVKARARQSRGKTLRSYDDKIEAGWSYACAHPRHLPNFCEKEQERGNLECSCSCHEARGFTRPSESSDYGSSDEEEILILD
jgi:hypothetical protein